MLDISISVEGWEFSIGCLLDSNLPQTQQSKTWVSNGLPVLPKALLSLHNQAGRIVIIALWWPVGCLSHLLHDELTQVMDEPHLNCDAWHLSL